jgi:hypothetical protein
MTVNKSQTTPSDCPTDSNGLLRDIPTLKSGRKTTPARRMDRNILDSLLPKAELLT